MGLSENAVASLRGEASLEEVGHWGTGEWMSLSFFFFKAWPYLMFTLCFLSVDAM